MSSFRLYFQNILLTQSNSCKSWSWFVTAFGFFFLFSLNMLWLSLACFLVYFRVGFATLNRQKCVGRQKSANISTKFKSRSSSPSSAVEDKGRRKCWGERQILPDDDEGEKLEISQRTNWGTKLIAMFLLSKISIIFL